MAKYNLFMTLKSFYIFKLGGPQEDHIFPVIKTVLILLEKTYQLIVFWVHLSFNYK